MRAREIPCTFHPLRETAPDPLKENDGIMVETAFVRRSPEGKLTFAAYVAAVRETVETEGSPECPMLLTVYGIEAAMGDGAVFGG